MRLLFGFALSICLASHGYLKKSLSTSGAAAAFFVGLGAMYNDWAVFPLLLLTFYFTGSRLTKLKAERKKQIDEEYQDGGQRSAVQVLCNALWGTLIAVWHQYTFGGGRITCLFEHPFTTKLFLLYLGHYATCNGDTWASEIGVLHKDWPILITTLKKVPPGTNGGVSPLGLVASLFGGFVIGIVAFVSLGLSGGCDRWMWELIPIASLAGFIGSLVDSVLGATVQKTLYSEKSRKITYATTADKGVKVITADKGVKVITADKDVKVISGWDLLDNNQLLLLRAV
ncbi:6488_t:CDS:2 [Ambispora gerdemannii]|uniref:6488_t:CDS:1 n=1 Tax=Ambispora gerdemannii TaxID=144530 RepID=A0A9N8YSW8_9GLOM|nr:6488_t:CDS:2 [Ambispora gerdemannii]